MPVGLYHRSSVNKVSYSFAFHMKRLLTISAVLVLFFPLCYSSENGLEQLNYCSSVEGDRVCQDCASTYYDVSLERCCWEPKMFEACVIADDVIATIRNLQDHGDVMQPLRNERRASYFLGKRLYEKKWGGPRNNFLGKREPEEVQVEYTKKAKPFLGKRSKPFLG